MKDFIVKMFWIFLVVKFSLVQAHACGFLGSSSDSKAEGPILRCANPLVLSVNNRSCLSSLAFEPIKVGEAGCHHLKRDKAIDLQLRSELCDLKLPQRLNNQEKMVILYNRFQYLCSLSQVNRLFINCEVGGEGSVPYIEFWFRLQVGYSWDATVDIEELNKEIYYGLKKVFANTDDVDTEGFQTRSVYSPGSIYIKPKKEKKSFWGRLCLSDQNADGNYTWENNYMEVLHSLLLDCHRVGYSYMAVSADSMVCKVAVALNPQDIWKYTAETSGFAGWKKIVFQVVCSEKNIKKNLVEIKK